MGANTAPDQEEVERFVELYEEIGTIKGVAEHEDVDWSRPTVGKWLRREGALDDGNSSDEEEGDDTPEAEGGIDEPAPQPDGRYEAEPGANGNPANLMEEPPAPNDILLNILERDPKIGEDEIAYISSFFDEYGQLSTSDVTDILSDININNKRMTISRVNRHYSKAINQRLREDPDLQYDMRWATLLTKTTGDQMYVQQAQQYEADQMGVGTIRPPAGGENGRGSMETTMQPPQSGGRNGSSAGIQPPSPSRVGGGPQQAQFPQGQPQQGPGQELDPFQQKLLEMLEQQLEDDEPQQQPTQESTSPTSQIQELIELQQQLEQLQPGDDQNDEVNEMIQQVSQQFNSRLAQLEEQLNDQGSGGPPTPDPTRGGSEKSTMAEIAQLAQTIEDPDLLETVIEMEMDPDVLEAKAKQQEAATESEWKKSLAESLSPAAAEKAVDAFMNLTSGISQQTNQRVNGQAQPRQQPAQQAQPRQQPPEPQTVQQDQREAEGRSVEVVEDDTGPARTPSGDAEASPLREEGEAELQEAQDAEEDTTEEDEE